MELMIDAIARRIGKEPYEVRLANLVRPEQMPFDNVTDKHFDSGDYPQLLRMAMDAIDLPAVRARQARGEPDGRLIGVGLAVFSEQTAHGTTADGKRRALYEQVFARLTPDGRLDLRAGIQSIGQGLETTLAQIASEYLGVAPADVHVKLGDTELSPYSSGAWGRAASSGRAARRRAPARSWRAAWRGSARRCCRPTSRRSRCATAGCSVRAEACRSATSRARSISLPRISPATSIPTASR
jgi:CO/xanthine dehydrogenase Mo-binding subunit